MHTVTETREKEQALDNYGSEISFPSPSRFEGLSQLPGGGWRSRWYLRRWLPWLAEPQLLAGSMVGFVDVDGLCQASSQSWEALEGGRGWSHDQHKSYPPSLPGSRGVGLSWAFERARAVGTLTINEKPTPREKRKAAYTKAGYPDRGHAETPDRLCSVQEVCGARAPWLADATPERATGQMEPAGKR